MAPATASPRWLVRSLIRAKTMTTRRARKPPTEARALAEVRSKPRVLMVVSVRNMIVRHGRCACREKTYMIIVGV